MKRIFRFCLVLALLVSPIVMTQQAYATVASTDNKITYTGDGATTVFPYNFRIFEDTDLVVTLVVIATGVETVQTITTHYSVSDVGETAGGNVTMVTHPETTEKIVIRRVMELIQELDLVDNAVTSVENYEDAYDKIVMITQQLDEENNRTITAGVSETADLTLPASVANKSIGWDSAGTALENKDVISSTAGTTTGNFLYYNGTTWVETDKASLVAGALTVTGSLTGNADTASIAPAGTLSGATLKSTVTASSLTSLGTIASLVATTADINAGTVDAVLGGTTPAAITGTVVEAGTSLAITGAGDDGVVATGIKDEDNMVSDSATHLSTQQSIKAYVDSVGAGSIVIDSLDAETTIADADTFVFYDDDAAVNKKVTLTSIQTLVQAPYIKLSDVKATTTGGGTFTSGDWRKRTVTEETDTGNHVAVSSSVIVLDAGTYECNISCPANGVNSHQARLRNTTGSATILLGTSGRSVSTATNSSLSIIVGRFTIAAAQNIEIQNKCQTTRENDGFGKAAYSGESEVYTVAEFWKVG